MMVCQEFIETYTEYRDELLSSDERARFDEHLRDCDSCRRYERVLTRGLTLWRRLPGSSTSPDFLPRLQHRLYHVEDAGKLSGRQHLGSAALVAVASVGLLAVTWLPFATRMVVEVELPPLAVQAPVSSFVERQPSLFKPGPYMPERFPLPLSPTLDDPGGLFLSSYHLTIMTGASIQPPLEPRSGQLDESR